MTYLNFYFYSLFVKKKHVIEFILCKKFHVHFRMLRKQVSNFDYRIKRIETDFITLNTIIRTFNFIVNLIFKNFKNKLKLNFEFQKRKFLIIFLTHQINNFNKIYFHFHGVIVCLNQIKI